MICRRGTKQPRKQELLSGLEATLLYGVSGQAPWYVALTSTSRNSSSPCQRCEFRYLDGSLDSVAHATAHALPHEAVEC